MQSADLREGPCPSLIPHNEGPWEWRVEGECGMGCIKQDGKVGRGRGVYWGGGGSENGWVRIESAGDGETIEGLGGIVGDGKGPYEC